MSQFKLNSDLSPRIKRIVAIFDLNSCKAEIERLKTELLRYEVQGHQGQVDLDKKTFELEKSLFNDGRQLQTEMVYNNKDNFERMDKIRDEKMLRESQKMELTHKIKSLQRRIKDDQERFRELEKQLQELTADNLKMQLQMDEMRSIYRNKLIQFTSDTVKGKSPEITARQELVGDFQDKEYKLQDERDLLKKMSNQQKMEIRALRSYARNLRYLAEDWAPLGIQLPEILLSEPPFMVNENYQINSPSQDQTNENERFKSRNRRLQDEVKALEKEKTEYMVRCTMAQEQLIIIQSNLTRITHEYQKKIQKLKKQIQF